MKDPAFAEAQITYDKQYDVIWLASYNGTLTLMNAKVSLQMKVTSSLTHVYY
jgi:hypothetical protein